jgi:hypothetical protein
MTNSLNRDLQPDEEVVLYQHILPRLPVRKRVFTVKDGPGTESDSSGTIIRVVGYTGEPWQIFGGWIDPAATEKWQRERKEQSDESQTVD